MFIIQILAIHGINSLLYNQEVVLDFQIQHINDFTTLMKMILGRFLEEDIFSIRTDTYEVTTFGSYHIMNTLQLKHGYEEILTVTMMQEWQKWWVKSSIKLTSIELGSISCLESTWTLNELDSTLWVSFTNTTLLLMDGIQMMNGIMWRSLTDDLNLIHWRTCMLSLMTLSCLLIDSLKFIKKIIQRLTIR